jgi:hypothetical protein
MGRINLLEIAARCLIVLNHTFIVDFLGFPAPEAFALGRRVEIEHFEVDTFIDVLWHHFPQLVTKS